MNKSATVLLTLTATHSRQTFQIIIIFIGRDGHEDKTKWPGWISASLAVALAIFSLISHIANTAARDAGEKKLRCQIHAATTILNRTRTEAEFENRKKQKQIVQLHFQIRNNLLYTYVHTIYSNQCCCVSELANTALV